MSPFWKGFLQNREIVETSISWIVKKGTEVSFWHDRWLGETNLASMFPSIYSIIQEKSIKVSKAFTDSVLH